ncbi:hypothetical protein CNMCM5793_004704 [Aspergillus hiratsukae]|uniref:SET domain-containing protein n=1 Tax=Aspergillus hiratsukae TaxID=1194566 RepID=A0A8H6UJ63_9EURO|nr:hypothetical protein CNMCM5793_004704 [Aspergillus hiratsukae]KAF7170606.1 hypothetical protein CNMCM6106_005248 [Aspergillus hiratsukae]
MGYYSFLHLREFFNVCVVPLIETRYNSALISWSIVMDACQPIYGHKDLRPLPSRPTDQALQGLLHGNRPGLPPTTIDETDCQLSMAEPSSPDISVAENHNQTQTTDMDFDASHLIEVRESPSKGLGVFAKANIPCGTRVIAEPALLEVSGRDANMNSNANDILQAYESLLPSQQKLYLSLHGFACTLYKEKVERDMRQDWLQLTELHRTVLSIYVANTFGAVFLLGSRINHSCVPNLDFSYNSALGKETFHAIRDISAGEELTISYINGSNRTRSQRRTELDKWGFQCTCEACEDTVRGREREEKRVQLFDLDQMLALDIRIGTKASCRMALQIVQRLAAIQKSEGLLGRELGLSYHDAARYCLKLGNARMALLWAQKELEVDRYCVGEDHPDFEIELDIVHRLRAAVEGSAPVDEVVTRWFRLHDWPITM